LRPPQPCFALGFAFWFEAACDAGAALGRLAAGGGGRCVGPSLWCWVRGVKEAGMASGRISTGPTGGGPGASSGCIALEVDGCCGSPPGVGGFTRQLSDEEGVGRNCWRKVPPPSAAGSHWAGLLLGPTGGHCRRREMFSLHVVTHPFRRSGEDRAECAAAADLFRRCAGGCETERQRASPVACRPPGVWRAGAAGCHRGHYQHQRSI